MSQTMKVKKGDTVQVLRGKDAGKKGRVLEALPKQGRVVVENINVVKRHRRPRPIQNTTGMVVCPVCGKPSRVGTIEKTVKDRTVRVRVCKRCGEEIDG